MDRARLRRSGRGADVLRRLRTGTPATHGGGRLRLLPSGPDLVHGWSPHGTWAIDATERRADPGAAPLEREFGPARADCRYRAPLPPRLARSAGDHTARRCSAACAITAAISSRKRPRPKRRAFSRGAAESNVQRLEALDRVGEARRRLLAEQHAGARRRRTESRGAADAVGDHRHARGLRLDRHDPEVLLAGEQQRAGAARAARRARRRGRWPSSSASAPAPAPQRPRARVHRRRPSAVRPGARRPRPRGRRACTARRGRRRGRSPRGSRASVEVVARRPRAGARPPPRARSSVAIRAATCVELATNTSGAGGARQVRAAQAAEQRRQHQRAARARSPRPRGSPAPTRSASACGSSRRAACPAGCGRSWRTRGCSTSTRSKPLRSNERTRGSSAAAASGSCASRPGSGSGTRRAPGAR